VFLKTGSYQAQLEKFMIFGEVRRKDDVEFLSQASYPFVHWRIVQVKLSKCTSLPPFPPEDLLQAGIGIYLRGLGLLPPDT
jgi:hypothetical protein